MANRVQQSSFHASINPHVIHTRLEKQNNQSHRYFAPLALLWMRGQPLPELIQNRYDYRKSRSKRGDPKIATVIREVFDDIEDKLRFKYVKYTNCYLDLLVEALRRAGFSEYTSRIPPIPLFLELGASSQTMVNLIGLGLSRTSAEILAARTANKEMDRVQTEAWLRRRDWHTEDVGEFVAREINRVLAATA